MTIESAIDEIRSLYSKGNAAERQKMQEQLRNLQDELYTDWEVLFSLVMGVS
jgi:demethylsterigmatocystin 6-O-methyltransferase